MIAFQYCRDKDVLLEVLKQKPDLNVQDKYGLTVVFYAFIFRKDKDILLEILRQKPDLNVQDKYGLTVVFYAFINCKDKDVLLELLKQKPDLNIKNKYEDTITMGAFIYCKDKDVLLEVLKQKPNLTLKNNFSNNSALDYALEHYVKSPYFEFDILEKLYNENCKQDKQLVNLDYIRIRRKYKVLPLILFRHQKRYGIKN